MSLGSEKRETAFTHIAKKGEEQDQFLSGNERRNIGELQKTGSSPQH